MHFLHQSESMDSLLAWSPFECERNKYAQRYYFSTAAKQRKLQPMILDRTVLDQTFRRMEGNRSTECKKEPAETTSGYRAKKARPESAIESESMDSLLAWSPLKCERNKYAQRYYLSTAAKQRKLQPTLLERTFRWLVGNQSTEYENDQAELTNMYRAKNERPESAIEVFGTKNCEKADYKVQIDKEYRTFEREFISLRVDSVQMLSCSGDRQTDNGWILIADRAQEYLSRVREFFDSKLSHINSMESTWTLRRRTLALEALKKMYARDVSRMDDWIKTVVEE